MRTNWSRGVAAIVILAVAAFCGRYYAALAAPYYKAAASSIAHFHPWRVLSVEVAQDPHSHSDILLMRGAVFRYKGDYQPAALLDSRVQVGETIETPAVFWGVLLLWPAMRISRWWVLLAGVPVFLGLEVLTSVCQLLQPMATASAMLAGDSNPVTPWDHWSRLLEAGGRFVLETLAALLTITLTLGLASLRKPSQATTGHYQHVDH